MPKVVLLIEDDRHIRDLLPRYFAQADITLLTAPDGMTGFTLFAERHPDLVLLDVNLPDLDGWSILKRIRHADVQQPVIMLTGRSDVPDRLLGLDLGADDYIVKPFEPLEVVARVNAVLRRATRASTAQEVLVFPGLRIDLAGRAVWRDDIPVNLTTKEFELLSSLARRQGRVLTRQQLYDIGWGDDALGDDHTLDVTMNRLRQKLMQGDERHYLTTIRGVGYKFEVRHGG